MLDFVEAAGDICVQHIAHLPPLERDCQRIQRLMLAAPRAKPVGEAEKVFLVDLVEDGNHGLLDQFVFYSRDGQRELHTTPASLWAGPRSVILSTHFVVRASLYLRRDV